MSEHISLGIATTCTLKFAFWLAHQNSSQLLKYFFLVGLASPRFQANRLKGWFYQLLVITMASEGTSSACMWKPVALMKKVLMKPLWGREAVWPSGFGHSIWNLEVPGSNPSPYCYLDLFLVVPSSTPRPRCGNSRQLVSLPPVRILNSLCSIWNIQLLI